MLIITEEIPTGLSCPFLRLGATLTGHQLVQ